MTKTTKPAPDLRMIASDIRMKRVAAKRILEDTAAILGIRIDYPAILWLNSFSCELDNGGVRLYQIRITNKGFWLLENQDIVKRQTKKGKAKNKGKFFAQADMLEKYLLTLLEKDIAAFMKE